MTIKEFFDVFDIKTIDCVSIEKDIYQIKHFNYLLEFQDIQNIKIERIYARLEQYELICLEIRLNDNDADTIFNKNQERALRVKTLEEELKKLK